MPEREQPLPNVPESTKVSRRKTPISLVWVIPIVAALLGAWVAATRIMNEGPTITITLETAEGLEAGKTKIHYSGVDVGTLTTIRLSPDHQQVIATAKMAPKTEDFLVEGTTFWVVRPRISGANVSGLGTLISGSYIGMEIGTSKQAKRDFVALDSPPVVTGDVPGRFFVLKTPELGSLDNGTPVYFRRLQVGQVASYAMNEDGRSLSVKVFVQEPYDRYVTEHTRFWQASGIDVALTASGLTVQTQSLLSILIGGIAFEAPPHSAAAPPSAADTEFTLFGDRTEAFKLPAQNPESYLLVFKESVRGLAVGAPVEFRGIPIGEVADITAQVDAKTMEFTVPVTIHLDAQRLGVKLVDLAPGETLEDIRKKLIDSLVAHGGRAQLRSGNLLTGQLYVAIDLFEDVRPATVDWSKTPIQLPTVPGQLQSLEQNVVNIIKKIDRLPIEQIGEDVQRTIVELERALASARGTLDSADRILAPDSVLGAELDSTLQEVSRAARGLRVLTDYLERHPEALLRGKPGGAD